MNDLARTHRTKGMVMNRFQWLWTLSMLVAVVESFAAPALVPGYLTPISVPGSSGTPQGIVVAKSDPSIIYWCRGGLWKSTNSGETWTRCGTLTNMVHARVNPTNPNHVYVASGVGGPNMGFWRSSDGGVTWEMPQGFKDAVSDPTVNTSDGYEVSVDPADFNHILFSFHSAWANSTTCGVLESLDGGTTWRKVNAADGTSGPGYGIFFLSNPGLGIGDKNTWLMGCQGAGYWRTANAGASWTKVLEPNMVHGGDQIYYSRNGALYTGADAGGVHRSIDNGITWKQAESMPASSYYLSVTGDGYFLYTASFNVNGPIYVTPESDGLNWRAYKQPDGTTPTLPMGTFEMALDSVNRILYFSSPQPATAGIWALKLLTPAISFSRQSISPASVVSDVDRDVVIALDIEGTISKATADLSLCGGSQQAALVHGTGNRWSLTHTIPAGMGGGLRNVVITAVSAGNDTATLSMALQITDNVTPVLVSQGKSTTTSSTQQGNVGANAVDGSKTTRWESSATPPQWLAVDLGATTKIHRVVIHWEAAFASEYSVQVSDDGTTWTQVYTTSSGNGGADEIFLAPIETRHVRVYCAQRGTNYAFSIYELEVFSYTIGKVAVFRHANPFRVRSTLSSSTTGWQVTLAEGTPWTLSIHTGSGRLIGRTSGVGSRWVPLGRQSGVVVATLTNNATQSVIRREINLGNGNDF